MGIGHVWALQAPVGGSDKVNDLKNPLSERASAGDWLFVRKDNWWNLLSLR
jgi:hypothetical protein